MKKTLYIKDAKGKLRMWSIEQKEDGLEIIHGLVDGKKQKEFEYIDFGLANRDKHEQRQLKFDSKVKRRMDQGYVLDRSVAELSVGRSLNSLGLPRPMLAHKYDSKHPVNGKFIQPKLDGHRCLISKRGGTLIAYSRNAKLILSIQHILDEVYRLDVDNIVLDGELYIHGEKLQKISSLVRKVQPESERLKYFVYDTVDEKTDFASRALQLSHAFGKQRFKHTSLLQTTICNNDLKHQFDLAIEDGFEGIMIRDPLSMYESGKRSKSLLKMKKFHDAEFKVVGIKKSADGWGIAVCETKKGDLFSVTAPGTAEEKLAVAEHPGNFIGGLITVEYAGMTKDGIPFHPVAKCWRYSEDD
jgi:DNA ligase-1